MPKTAFYCALFFLFALFSAQAQTLTGTIKDDFDEPLENANVIARATNGKKGIKFAMADHLGRYKMEMDTATNYTITVNYIGHVGDTLHYNYQKPTTHHDFVLINKGEELKELVIEYDYQPVIVKKDTLIYDVSAFTDGTERKLRDQLEKLPGVEVTDEGQVKVQGKTVNQFMVEGQGFFGGGSRLGVENIPADAVDKVEVLDHFTEVGHMKEVSGSDDLAMNIKLKEDKKKFVFGDIRTGAGNNQFYETNASLFYYSPKINWSVIGNLNNFGSQLLTYDEIIRFEGIRSIYTRNNNQEQLINLHSYMEPNTDVEENRNQFLASDIRYSFNKKWDIKGLFLMNKNWQQSKTEQSIEYLQNQGITFEERWNNANSKNQLFSGRINVDFRQNRNTTWKYNIQLAATNNNRLSEVLSVSENEQKKLVSSSDVDNFALSQLFEFHKTINKKHKASFVATHLYRKETPEYRWESNQPFLADAILWNAANNYALREVQNSNHNQFQLNLKHYWIAARNHHFYTTLGYDFTQTNLSISNHLSDNESWQSLYNQGFDNQLLYELYNPYVGLEYKFLYKKFTSTIGLFANIYQLDNQYPDKNHRFTTTQLEPEINLEYEFNRSESLKFTYRLNNQFMDASTYTDRWQISSFNALYKGNALLSNLQYQTAFLRYSNFSMYSGFTTYGSISYNKRNKNIRNSVEISGIDQLYETMMVNSPQSNLNAHASISKRFKKIELSVNGSVSWNKYTQLTNNEEVNFKQNSQSIGGGIRTLFKQAPNITVRYSKYFNQMYSSFDNVSQSDSFTISLDAKFLENFLLKADYTWYQNSYKSEKIITQQTNAYLEFHKKDNPWTFMFKGNNLLNNGIKNQISFSDFMIHNSTTYILPRSILFSVQYKL